MSLENESPVQRSEAEKLYDRVHLACEHYLRSKRYNKMDNVSRLAVETAVRMIAAQTIRSRQRDLEKVRFPGEFYRLEEAWKIGDPQHRDGMILQRRLHALINPTFQSRSGIPAVTSHILNDVIRMEIEGTVGYAPRERPNRISSEGGIKYAGRLTGRKIERRSPFEHY